MKLQFLNEKKSKACSMLMTETGISRFKKEYPADMLINYGVTGKKLEKFYAKYPRAKGISVINARCGINKYRALRLVSDFGVLTPDSKIRLSNNDKLDNWLEKKYKSYGGDGICLAQQRHPLKNKYYQRFISDRLFELRVHAFSWLVEKEWLVLKRTGSKDVIAWNFAQGGHFSTLIKDVTIANKARKIASDVLKVLHLEFGAVDFIVDSKGNIYFIEINSQPGMTGLSDTTYINAFKKLKDMSKENIIKHFNHIVQYR